jgi:LytS/YehU family sensor histidine kinase
VAKENGKESYIHIVFDLTRHDRLTFSVKNNKYESPEPGERHKEGIGLSNVRRRLKLLYPSMHELKITESGNEFHVELKLETA